MQSASSIITLTTQVTLNTTGHFNDIVIEIDLVLKDDQTHGFGHPWA